jgi:hypothetical protein
VALAFLAIAKEEAEMELKQMKRARVFDEDGNEVDDRICPPGGRVSVPFQFMDSRSVHVQLHRPGYVQRALSDGFEATTGNQRAQTAAEAARTAWINRVSNQWRQAWQQMPPPGAHKAKPGLISSADTEDNAEGVSTTSENLPEDIATMPISEQLRYCRAYNQHMEENPDATEADCDEAGRTALAGHGDSVADAAAHLERVRQEIDIAQRRRLENAWRQR